MLRRWLVRYVGTDWVGDLPGVAMPEGAFLGFAYHGGGPFRILRRGRVRRNGTRPDTELRSPSSQNGKARSNLDRDGDPSAVVA